MAHQVRRLGVVGAGTMGAEIASLALATGLEARVFDPDAKAREEAAARGLEAVDSLAGLAGCELVVEAAPEDLELKRRLFAELAADLGPEVLLATNTSSLSVDAIATAVPGPERFLGLHFFNPPRAMRLVEIVAGHRTSTAAIEAAAALVVSLDRTGIRVADGIGFLANRCARPYVLEGLRAAARLRLDPAEFDRACRLALGFPMGPFELIDLVGADVSLRVAESFYEQSFGEPRWRPHLTQARMVAAGRLGRKSGAGFYDYGDGPHRDPDPDLEDPRPIRDSKRLAALAGPCAAEAVESVVAAIVNEAGFALEDGVAAEADVDTAMRLGYRWPLGPIGLLDAYGAPVLLARLEQLRELHGEAHRPSPWLRERASSRSTAAASRPLHAAGAESSSPATPLRAESRPSIALVDPFVSEQLG